ncbi:MAG: molybdopterin molybdenumtransferase MoeA, partial [Sedimenticola sp.]|nr:molybdopterin molybdenumtransferase MoeA [Sedimenticola sp.]MCW8882656.1 molybdopterin molybdenumtransferase MoeA [Sedimenticola sp.]
MSDCGCDAVTDCLKPLEEALALLLSHARAVEEIETVSLAEANGRVLAESVVSQINMPPWDNSAMDGYAVNTADLTAAGTQLVVSQRIPAGAAPTPLEPGTAARIFTGAPVPANANAVVIQEVCEQTGD